MMYSNLCRYSTVTKILIRGAGNFSVLNSNIEQMERKVHALESKFGHVDPKMMGAEIDKMERKMHALGSKFDRLESIVMCAEKLLELNSESDKMGKKVDDSSPNSILWSRF